MPDDERMSPAEFRVVREFLGLSGPWLARHLEVTDRTIRHWEAGRYPVPDGVREAVEKIAADADTAVATGIADLRDVVDPVLLVPATDQATPGTYPATWYRAVAGRIAQQIPAHIGYAREG